MRVDSDTLVKIIINFSDSMRQLSSIVNKLPSEAEMNFIPEGLKLIGSNNEKFTKVMASNTVIKGVTYKLTAFDDGIEEIVIKDNRLLVLRDSQQVNHKLKESEISYDDYIIGTPQSLGLDDDSQIISTLDDTITYYIKEQDINAMLAMIDDTAELIRLINICFGDDIAKLDARLSKLK